MTLRSWLERQSIFKLFIWLTIAHMILLYVLLIGGENEIEPFSSFLNWYEPIIEDKFFGSSTTLGLFQSFETMLASPISLMTTILVGLIHMTFREQITKKLFYAQLIYFAVFGVLGIFMPFLWFPLVGALFVSVPLYS